MSVIAVGSTWTDYCGGGGWSRRGDRCWSRRSWGQGLHRQQRVANLPEGGACRPARSLEGSIKVPSEPAKRYLPRRRSSRCAWGPGVFRPVFETFRRQSDAQFLQDLFGFHPEFALASIQSFRMPLDHCPAAGIVHDERPTWNFLGDQRTTCIRVVIYGCDVGQGEIQLTHIRQSGVIAADHDLARDVVPTLAHAAGNTLNGCLW
jgi:hypothetical protein